MRGLPPILRRYTDGHAICQTDLGGYPPVRRSSILFATSSQTAAKPRSSSLPQTFSVFSASCRYIAASCGSIPIQACHCVRDLSRWRVAERGQVPHRLALGVDRLPAAARISAPVRYQPPAQRIERHPAGPVIAAGDEQLLARRRVPPRRVVVHAAVARVHAVDDGVSKRSAALDDSPARGGGYSDGRAEMPPSRAVPLPDEWFRCLSRMDDGRPTCPLMDRRRQLAPVGFDRSDQLVLNLTLDRFEPLLRTNGTTLSVLYFCLKLRDPILGGT
jgi:hypothetical protein